MLFKFPETESFDLDDSDIERLVEDLSDKFPQYSWDLQNSNGKDYIRVNSDNLFEEAVKAFIDGWIAGQIK